MIMRLSNKSMGFTLAEVLITLGIIGVVAAMTMPTLMNSTQGAQYKAAYKKALSAISQGVTLNVALDGGSFADTTAASAGSYSTANSIAKLLSDRMNVVSATGTAPTEYASLGNVAFTCDSTKHPTGCTAGNVTPDTYIYFNDGSMFAIEAGSTACTDGSDSGKTAKICHGFIDVNGKKGPNKVTTDAATPKDIYPVEFYDQTILPASDAARAILYDGKTNASSSTTTTTTTNNAQAGS